MSTATGEIGFNATAATSDYTHLSFVPAANDEQEPRFEIESPPEPRPEKKRKSKWLLKQMARRGPSWR